MDFANSALVEDAALGTGNSSKVCGYQRKYLSLEARHSKAIERGRKLRSKLSTSIFIPKQPLKSLKRPEKTLAIPLSKTKYQVTTAIKKSDQDCAKEPQRYTTNDTHKQFSLQPNLTDKQEENKQLKPKVLTPYKKWKHRQYRKYLLEGKHVIRTTMELPWEQNHQSQQDKTERTIEDELKSMGLEVTSDTEIFENIIGEGSGCNETANESIKRLSLQEANIPAKEQANENTDLKSRERRKSIEREINTNSLAKEANSIEEEIQTNSLAKEAKSIEEEIHTSSLAKDAQSIEEEIHTSSLAKEPQSIEEEIHTNSLVHRKKKQKKARIRDSNLVETKPKEIKEIYQNYNDSLHAVNEFQTVLLPLAMDDVAIHNNLTELDSSINEFSAFLYRTYRSLELMEALPSCINQHLQVAPPSKLPLASTDFIIRIDVPDLMEQTITLDSNEIMQHTIENYERNKFQELVHMEKSIKYKSPNDQIKTPAMRKDIAVPVTAVANGCRERTVISKTGLINRLRKHRGSTLTSQSKPLRNQKEPKTGAKIPTVITQHSESIQPENNSTHPFHLNRKPSNVVAYLEMQNEAAKCHRNEHNFPGGSNAEHMSDPYKEPQIHPAFRNSIFHNNNRNNVTQHDVMPQPNSTSLPSAPTNLQYLHNPALPQTSASIWDNISRQSVLHPPPPRPFQIPFPFATQLTPMTESREYFSTYPSTNVNPLLTPPQSMECQALPMFRPPSYYPPTYPQSYTQSTFIPMTPPSEDTIRYEAAYHQHLPPSMPPMMFPPAIGLYPQAL